MSRLRAPIDLLLLLVALLWAINYSVVKAAIAHVPPLAFNTLRLTSASLLLWSVVYFVKKEGLPREDWGRLTILAVVGHTLYQVCFILGLSATTVTHSSLVLGMTPIVVALLGVIVNAERPSTGAWGGLFLSLVGVYLVIGPGPSEPGGIKGDLLTMGATFCWSLYTVGAGPLLERHGALKVTATTLALGTLLFAPLGVPAIARLPFASVPPSAWLGLLFSAVFALVVCYSLWYYAVARIGATRTAVYSNLTPVAAVIVSIIVLGERVRPVQILGAALIFGGVYFVRKSKRLIQPNRADTMGAAAPGR